jgi:hypothetical protein
MLELVHYVLRTFAYATKIRLRKFNKRNTFFTGENIPIYGLLFLPHQDGGTPTLSTTISLTVDVLDVLDPAPHFTQSTYRVEVAEGAYSMVIKTLLIINLYSISTLWKLIIFM